MVKEYVQKENEPKKDYAPTLRTKLCLTGNGATKFYKKVGEGPDGKLILENATHLDLKPFDGAIPIVDILGLWFMATMIGISVQCVSVIIVPNVQHGDASFVGMDVEIVSNTPTITSPVPGSSTITQQPPLVPTDQHMEIVDPNDYNMSENP